MMIKKLELQGFKSFPERTKIILHAGITAIVGPNGTGKSNIVDAILWVLGGQRIKSLRGEKIEDIIFNGNAKKAPLGMADVNLYLGDNEEELIIHHRAFRSGESEYRLNGKPVRLKDIQDALWKRAVAEKEYYVIEQGAIGQFVTSKPSEKRVLLEEAAGTAFYKDKKKQAESKLENSEQNLVRLQDIISEVEKAKNFLQRQAQAANRYRKLREKIRELTALHYQRKIKQLEIKLQDILGRYNHSLNQERDIASRIQSQEKELASKRKELWDLEKSLKENKEHLFALKSQVSRLETEREKETRRIEYFEEERKKTISNIKEKKQELVLLETELNQNQISLQELGDALAIKQQGIEDAEKENRLAKEKIPDKENELESIRNAHLQKFSELTEAKNEKVKLDKELEFILRQEKKLKDEISKEQTLLEQKEKKLSENQESLVQIRIRVEERERTLATLLSALDEIFAANENLQKKIASLKEKRNEHFYHLQTLKKLEEKERHGTLVSDIPGSLGLLADLIETDSEHAPLVDVFWKEEVKAALIPVQDFLKNLAESQIKGNFLLILPQKKEEFSKEAYHDPAVIGLLKSRLRFSPKIKEHLLQLKEAAIVRDIKNAIDLWLRFPELNYITLDGDLLLSSGFLKMGQKEEGIMALSQEIRKLDEILAQKDKEIFPLSMELDEKGKKKQELEEKIQAETSLKAQEERKIEEQQKERQFDEVEKEKILNNLSILNQELRILLSEKSNLSQKLEALSARIQTLEDEEKTLKEKSEAEERELALHQDQINREGSRILELKAGRELLNEKINNFSLQSQSFAQRKGNAEAKISSFEEEIRSCDEEEIRLKQHIEELSQKAKTLEQERSLKDTRLAKDELKFQNWQKEIEEQENTIQKLREDLEVLKEERVRWEVSKAETERDMVNLEETCWQDLKKTLQEVKKETFEEVTPDSEVEARLEEAQEDLQNYKAVNLMAEEEYLAQKERYDFLIQQRNDLRESITTTKEAIRKIDEESKSQFITALAEVNKNFKEIFSILFNGGVAEVKLIDPENPLESGVEIIAQPPGKRVQNLALLSGGEKSLTSLAFLFALFRYKPTPFCILDEVDAALDEANLVRFLELMKKIKSDTQFVLITHNFKTMEVADFIYGTTMVEPNITSLYSIKLEKKPEEFKLQ
jgi:chromosome segregation protein